MDQPMSDHMSDHMAQMKQGHARHLWCHLACMLIGVWLMSSPPILGTLDPSNIGVRAVQVTQERHLAAIDSRQLWLACSDVASGALMVVFGGLSLFWRHRWAQWGTCAVGLWLVSAPILLWAPNASVYLNDTVAGSLAIAFSILVPMMPGMDMKAMMAREDIPPGWSYSPSSWSQRLPIIALAFVGFFIARYLSAYQMGHIASVWDPFFGDGTREIITSDVSKAWPAADGGVGAMSYMAEILMGAMGGRARWRTMPWMVLLFGIVVVPLGVISIYFIIIQPIAIGTYCTICLAAALAMLIMIPFALDELVAMGQFLVLNTRRGRPFWRAFFRGDALPGGGVDKHPGFGGAFAATLASAARGVNLPWTLLASALIGLWLMLSRVTLGTVPPLADSDHLVGALVVTTAVIAMAEVARPLRFVNAAFGAWLVIAPWILDGGETAANVAGVIAGLALVGLSLPRGPRSREHYGTWDRYIV